MATNVFDVLQYSNFLRIYFTLTPFKETSQWDVTDDSKHGDTRAVYGYWTK